MSDTGGSRTTAAAPVRPTGPGTGHSTDWDLVTVPAREGLEAADILRLRDDVGPVLHDGSGATLGFLVPPGTADAWDVPGSACAPTCGGGARRLRPGEPPVAGARWLVPPERAYVAATEPGRLRAALAEAGRLLRAAGRL
ncbi:hypothetical protein WDH52_19005 [Streptomyces sp. TRM70308]|uniref:hypothetical protein n=1 Tax=Streptomyces TaxID=1883 RepID=UPI002248F3AA|nr:hypothetical protein [Streptomyces sp. JHD 1]MCX2971119.1 hypothetical protein [Streptomyces sp. JHD 1]